MKKLILTIGMLLTIVICNAQIVKKYYHDNGNKELLSYNDSLKLDGVCKTWNADGKLIAKALYVNGKKHGHWKIYYENGRLAYAMKYNYGEKTGNWKSYDDNGKLINSKNYD
jgi:antitoxin component YwqK of YwqJK toxin-antitoxin module